MQTIGHSVNQKVWLTLQSVCGECYAASVSYLCAGMCVCVCLHTRVSEHGKSDTNLQRSYTRSIPCTNVTEVL